MIYSWAENKRDHVSHNSWGKAFPCQPEKAVGWDAITHSSSHMKSHYKNGNAERSEKIMDIYTFIIRIYYFYHSLSFPTLAANGERETHMKRPAFINNANCAWSDDESQSKSLFPPQLSSLLPPEKKSTNLQREQRVQSEIKALIGSVIWTQLYPLPEGLERVLANSSVNVTITGSLMQPPGLPDPNVDFDSLNPCRIGRTGTTLVSIASGKLMWWVALSGQKLTWMWNSDL